MSKKSRTNKWYAVCFFVILVGVVAPTVAREPTWSHVLFGAVVVVAGTLIVYGVSALARSGRNDRQDA